MFKKLLCSLLALVLVISLCACGNGAKNTDTNSQPTSAEKGESNTEKDGFKISGQMLQIGMNLTEDVLKNLGTPTDVQTAPSCHFDGEDTIYVYEAYTLYTYADGDKNVLYLIELTGEGVSTPEGIKIGSACDEVKNIYGNPTEETEGYYTYETVSSLIRFSHDGDTVGLIEYEEKE